MFIAVVPAIFGTFKKTFTFQTWSRCEPGGSCSAALTCLEAVSTLATPPWLHLFSTLATPPWLHLFSTLATPPWLHLFSILATPQRRKATEPRFAWRRRSSFSWRSSTINFHFIHTMMKSCLEDSEGSQTHRSQVEENPPATSSVF